MHGTNLKPFYWNDEELVRSIFGTKLCKMLKPLCKVETRFVPQSSRK